MDILPFAEQVLDEVRALLLNDWRHPLISERKEDASIVTEADRRAEEVIRRRISEAFPNHGILGEEYGTTTASHLPAASQDNMVWVIDPIDGTLSFSHGLPLFGTLLACYRGDEQVLGAIELPALGERYIAVATGELLLNGTPMQPQPSSDEPLIATGDEKWFQDAGMGELYDALTSQYFCRTLPDCFGHAMALRGSVDVLVDVNLNYWDIAASPLLFKKAGKTFRIFDERNVDGVQKYDIICGDPNLVSRLTSDERALRPTVSQP